jgi:hypothetical protein
MIISQSIIDCLSYLAVRLYISVLPRVLSILPAYIINKPTRLQMSSQFGIIQRLILPPPTSGGRNPFFSFCLAFSPESSLRLDTTEQQQTRSLKIYFSYSLIYYQGLFNSDPAIRVLYTRSTTTCTKIDRKCG